MSFRIDVILQLLSHAIILMFLAVIFHYLKSLKYFLHKIIHLKPAVLISMYDQTLTFFHDIFVTFHPNGATERVDMACIKPLCVCVRVCVGTRG